MSFSRMDCEAHLVLGSLKVANFFEGTNGFDDFRQ